MREVGSSIPPLGLQGGEPAWVALGKIAQSQGSPGVGNGEPFLSMLYLELIQFKSQNVSLNPLPGTILS